MPNTAKKTGKNSTKTFIDALLSQEAEPLMSILDILHVHDTASHEQAIQLMGDLMDEIGDVESHPAHRYMELLTEAIARYESQIYPSIFAQVKPEDKALEMLKFLMEAQSVKQTDLADIFGSQGNVSQILKGERKLSNVEHIRKLAVRFKVDPAVFI